MAPDPRLSEQLLTASGRGLAELVVLLLQRRAHAGHARGDGWTPLMAACSSGHASIARALLEHGANPGAAAGDGFTALMEACTNGHYEVVDLLLRAGSDLAQASDGTSPLLLASLYGHAAVVELLLGARADPAQATQRGFTALRAACGNGHAAVAAMLLNRGGASVDSTDAFVSACANGHVAVARHLLELGALATSTSADGTSALLHACMATHREVAVLLIASKADVDAAFAATRHKSLSGARRVLERAVHEAAKSVPERSGETRDLDALLRDIEGQAPTPTPSRMPKRRSTGRVAAATSAGASRHVAPGEHAGGRDRGRGAAPAADEQGSAWTDGAGEHAAPAVAGDAVGAGLAEAAAVTAGGAQCSGGVAADDAAAADAAAADAAAADAAAADDAAATAAQDRRKLEAEFLSACSHGREEVARLLLERLGRGSLRDLSREPDGWTPLMAACGAGHLGVVQLLLQGHIPGAADAVDLDAAASDGFTALLEASACGHAPVVEALLRHGASVSRASLDGSTPLVLASLHGHAEIAAALLRSRADVWQARPNGFTALRAACGNGHVGVAEALLGSGASAAGAEGAAALVSACANGHVAVVRRLVDGAGVPAGSRSADGVSALLQACMAGHHETAAFLLARGACEHQALEAARRQSCLSGVRRVLARARVAGGAARAEAETRDLDDLVREIEGPRPRRPAAGVGVGRGRGRGQSRIRAPQAAAESPQARPRRRSGEAWRRSGGAFSALQEDRSSSASAEEDEDDEEFEEEEEEEEEEEGAQAPAERAAAHQAQDPGVAPATARDEDEEFEEAEEEEKEEEAPAERAAAHQAPGVPSAVARLPSAVVTPSSHCGGAAAGPEAGEGWATRRFRSVYRSPGTVYTIEVLGVEGRSPGAPRRAPMAAGSRAVAPWASERGSRNLAVVTARCAGRPVAELALIPLEDWERADWERLAASGIPVVAASASPRRCSDAAPPPRARRQQSPPLSSRSPSLPDRDAPEEYAAWCRRRGQEASGPPEAPAPQCGLAS